MKLILGFAVLALAAGCAGDRDGKDVTLTSTGPRFSEHHGRPTGRQSSHAATSEDDPWWSSLIGGILDTLFSGSDTESSADGSFNTF